MEKYLPYMSSREIIHLMCYIDRDTKMLEIGGGGSSVFLSKFVKELTTVEHDIEWSKKISAIIFGKNRNWKLHLIEPNWPQTHCFAPAENGQFDNYVEFISTLPNEEYDVVLIDGRDRVRSVEKSLPKLKTGGVLLIHDFWNRPKYHKILQIGEIELIEDNNSFRNFDDDTLVVFRKK
jgi:predicted O-methyltransferase YrrM